MKSPKNLRFERICENQSFGMMPPSPPIETEEDIAPHDAAPPSSPPPEAPESLVSSPQGSITAPKPVASFSPIAIQTVQTIPSVQSSPAMKSFPSSAGSIPSIPDAPLVSQPGTSTLPLCQEDLRTPKAAVKEDTEVTKPEKIKKSEVNSRGQMSRRLVFSTKPKARQSKTKKAGLVMSVARVLGRLKAGRYSRRVGVTGAVYLAATLEYLVAEVLELAGNCARFFRKKRVSPRCIQLSLLHDKELDQLTRGVIVPQGGVRPYIHPVLLGKTLPGGQGGGGPEQEAGGPEDQMLRRSYLEEEGEEEIQEE